MQTKQARRRVRDRSERGAGLVEYALLVALIAVVCIAAVTFVGTSGSGRLGDAGAGLGSGDGGSTSTTDPGGAPSASTYTNRTACLAAGKVWIMGRCYEPESP